MNTELEQTVAALRTRLQQLQPTQVDPQLRAQLLALLSDLGRLLGPDGLDQEQPLVARLEAVAVRFEAEHPAVGIAVRQLVDALAKAGI